MPSGIGGLGRWQKLALAAVAGGIGSLGLAPYNVWYVVFPALALLIALVATASGPRSALLLAWAGGAGWFGVSLYWIVEPFLVEPEVTGWMAPFALVLLAAGLALFWALAGGLSGRIAQGPSRAIVFAGLLTLAEALRATAFTGFPWAHPGHTLISSEWLHLSALLGPHGLTLTVLGLSGLSAALVLRHGPALAGLPLAAGLAGGLLPLVPAAPLPASDAPVIRLIQPNAPQHLKWDEEYIPVFFDRGLELTAQAADPLLGPPDLVIWSETSLPPILERSDAARSQIAQAAGGAAIILGGQRYEGLRPRNTLAVLVPDGRISQLYDKHHLVPFGEYLPFRALADRWGLDGIAARLEGGYAPGSGPAILDLGALGQVFPMICYEAIFPEYIRQVERPDWMVQITNDAWFGSFAGPRQHLAIARLRAAEQGLPLLRAANTGVSAVIDARGQIVESLAMDVAGALDAALPVALPPTPYSRVGDWPALILALFVTLGGLAPGRHRQPH